jgi:hypothetical protein
MAEPKIVADLIAKHLPPSVDRVRLRALDAASHAWVSALTAAHAVVLADAGECDATLAADLALIPQVKVRPGGRAIFLLASERRSLPELAALLGDAGFTRILVEPVLDGVFILARGEPLRTAREYPAGDAASEVDFSVIRAGGQLPRYVHVLVRQEPPARGWEQLDPASIVWEAMTVNDAATGQVTLLGFSSLVKAVAFMKPAALAGAMPRVDKLPRYRGETVASWGVPVLLNPTFEALHSAARFAWGSPPLQVDPRAEDKIRE